MSKKITNAEFINRMQIINPNIKFLSEYNGSKEYIKCMCIIDKHEWNAMGSKLLSGRGCPKCAITKLSEPRTYTNKEFSKLMKEINPNIELLSEYLGYGKNIKCKCLICGHIWNRKQAGALLRGTSCLKCTIFNRKLKYTTNEFIDKIKTISQNIEILSEYFGSNEDIKCKCLIDNHEWSATATSLLIGNGCPLCANNKRRKTHDKYIEEVNLINSDIEVLEEYKSSTIKIKHRCKIDGHEWNVSPSEILTNRGCPKCAGRCKTHEEYVSEVKIIFPYIEVIDKYINTITKITHKCTIHNYEWETAPHEILKERGCPICSESKGERKIYKYLVNNNIEFIPQYTFDDLIGLKNGLLRYDFYLPRYGLIEYQGEFHDGSVPDDIQSEEDFKNQQEHDKRKRDYTQLNNIKLLEIWYWDFDNIENILERELKS